MCGVFGNRHDAEIALARLHADDIDGWIVTDDGGGMFPQLTSATLLVAAPDAAAAADALGVDVRSLQTERIEARLPTRHLVLYLTAGALVIVAALILIALK